MIVNTRAAGGSVAEAFERYRTAVDAHAGQSRRPLQGTDDNAVTSTNVGLQRAETAMISQADAMAQSALANDGTPGDLDAQSALETALSARTELASITLNILNAEVSKISALLKTG
jgi:hypothetical protein